MNTKILGMILFVVIIVIVGVIWLSSDDSGSNSNINQTSGLNVNTQTTNTAPLNGNTNAAAPDTASVSASSTTGFAPNSVTISVGGTVTWTNTGSDMVYVAPDQHPDHTDYLGVWEDDGTGEISSGETYVVQFFTAGTYQYHDHENDSSTGTVTVQ